MTNILLSFNHQRENNLNPKRKQTDEIQKKIIKRRSFKMKVIYENQVKAAGECVEEFKDAGMFIIFGENAPDEIKDYCYSVSVNPINGDIAPGQYVVIDGQEFKITCVGYEAPITLKGLGHCTFNFSGATEAELPGTIYVEAKPMPEVKIGTTLKIIEK